MTHRQDTLSDLGLPLTRRMETVLAAYAITGSRIEAARWLGLSPHTVRAHLSVIYARTGSTDVLSALRHVRWLRVPVTRWPAPPFPFADPPARRKGWRREKPLR